MYFERIFYQSVLKSIFDFCIIFFINRYTTSTSLPVNHDSQKCHYPDCDHVDIPQHCYVQHIQLDTPSAVSELQRLDVSKKKKLKKVTNYY